MPRAYRILDSDPAVQTKISTPLSVDLAFQVERLLLVRDVAGCDDQRKAEPQKEGVECQESPIVQQDTRKAHDGRQET